MKLYHILSPCEQRAFEISMDITQKCSLIAQNTNLTLNWNCYRDRMEAIFLNQPTYILFVKMRERGRENCQNTEKS